MTTYSPETSKKYTDIRNSIISTDKEVFRSLNRIDLSGKDVLDFGCGDGRYAVKLTELGAKSTIGIDISPAMIELANRQFGKHRGVKFIVADGNNLPSPAKSFDLVFSNFVLQHFADTLKPLREIHRVLRSNGYFLGTFTVTEVKAGAEYLFNTEVPIRLGTYEFVIVHPLIKSEREIRENLDRSAFRIIEFHEVNNPDATIDPSFAHRNMIKSYKTILCLVQKI